MKTKFFKLKAVATLLTVLALTSAPIMGKTSGVIRITGVVPETTQMTIPTLTKFEIDSLSTMKNQNLQIATNNVSGYTLDIKSEKTGESISKNVPGSTELTTFSIGEMLETMTLSEQQTFSVNLVSLN